MLAFLAVALPLASDARSQRVVQVGPIRSGSTLVRFTYLTDEGVVPEAVLQAAVDARDLPLGERMERIVCQRANRLS